MRRVIPFLKIVTRIAPLVSAFTLALASGTGCSVDNNGLAESSTKLQRDAGAGGQPGVSTGTGGARPGSGGSGPIGTGGAVETGGTMGTGGLSGTGGATNPNGTGGGLGSGGMVGTGGERGTGGASGTGGEPGTGGAIGTGGATGTGGAIGTGGEPGTGGTVGTGGVPGTGGTMPGTGGATSTGGVVGTGGAPGTGGSGGMIGTGGMTGTGGMNATGGTSGGTGGTAGPKCGPTTCNGCCGPNGCVHIPTAAACGSKGAACVACGGCDTCSAGSCAIDPNSQWTIVADAIKVDMSPPGGGTWDPAHGDEGGTAPDLFCEYENPANDVSATTAGVTGTVVDVYSTDWDEVISPAGLTVSASVLMAAKPTWRIWVGDEDCSSPTMCGTLGQTVCSYQQPISADSLEAGQLTISNYQSCASLTLSFVCQAPVTSSP